MNPLQLMNNDMATLILSSQKIFEHWNDKVAETMKNGCIRDIQKEWKTYIDDMNVRMKIFMQAEMKIEQVMRDYEQKKNK